MMLHSFSSATSELYKSLTYLLLVVWQEDHPICKKLHSYWYRGSFLRLLGYRSGKLLLYTTFTLSRLRPWSSRLLNRNWSCSFWSNLPSEHDLIRLHAISDDCNTTDDDLVPVHIRSDTRVDLRLGTIWYVPQRYDTFTYDH